MTATIDHIKSEIRSLDPRLVEVLLRDLQNEYVMPESKEGADVESSWDKEISKRVKEVEEGKVELISGKESERRIDALFTKHGLQRRTA